MLVLIHDTWGFELYLSDVSRSGTSYIGKLKVVIYDHFGLDKTDVKKFAGKLGIGVGFRSWFILQHYAQFNAQHKAFVTLIQLNEIF